MARGQERPHGRTTDDTCPPGHDYPHLSILHNERITHNLRRLRARLDSGAEPGGLGVGRPDQWSHLVHTDDLGSAVVASLHAPTGVYNVGAAPVLRRELVDGYAKAVDADEGSFMGPVLRRLAGPRAEPLTRSLRVSSDHFSAQTGWRPSRPTFDPAWFEAAALPAAAAR